jgi:hypothetical protein
MTNKAKAEGPIGFRPPVDLKAKMDQWLAKNPGIDRSTMICLAVDKFISAPHTLEPVEVVVADHQEAMKVAAAMMDKHAHALEKLK